MARSPVPAAEGWPGPELAGFLPKYGRMLAEDPTVAPWGVWLMLHEGKIVGDIGFTGHPDEAGRVEIGYSILPEYRGQGLTQEAVRAMVAFAFTHARITAVRADVEEENEPSHSVLAKAGFTRFGLTEGLVKWEIRRPA